MKNIAKRAAALFLAVAMTLSTGTPVLALSTDGAPASPPVAASAEPTATPEDPTPKETPPAETSDEDPDGEPDGEPGVLSDETTAPANGAMTLSLSAPALVQVDKYWNDNNKNAAYDGTLQVTLQGKTAAHTVEASVSLNHGDNWALFVSTLPKLDETGEAYVYTLTGEETYLDAEGNPTDLLNDYLPQVMEPPTDDMSHTITILVLRNTLKTDYTATKVWNDHDNSYGTRPTPAEYLDCLTLQQRVGDADPTAVEGTLTDYLTITEGDDNSWALSLSNLPAFAQDNTPIEYILVESAVPLKAGNTAYEDTVYEAEYENTVNYSTELTSLYTGGTLRNTLAKSGTVTVKKVWLDDGTAPTKRPTGTLFLYRYVAGEGSYRTASPVQGMTAELEQEDKTYAFEGEDEARLPLYDTEGRKYVYYVKEVYDAGDFNTYEKYVDPEFRVVRPDVAGSPDAVEQTLPTDGGTLYNRRVGTANLRLEKTFAVGAILNHSFAATIQLQQWDEDADAWVDSTTADGSKNCVVLENFSAEQLTKAASFSVPAFDEEGLPIQYRAVESAITIDGETAESDTGSFADGDLANVGADVLNGGDEHGYQIRVTVDEDAGTITNTLVAETDMVIQKVWKDADGNVVERPCETVTAVVVGSDGSRSDPVTLTDAAPAEVKNLPRYDADGKEILYTVVENSVAGYSASYSYTDAAPCNGDTGGNTEHNFVRTATITNAPGQGGTYIHVKKEWFDDGDADHRGPVTVGIYEGTTRKTGGTLTADGNWEGWFRVSNENDYDCSGLTVREDSVLYGGTAYTTLYTAQSIEDAINGIEAEGLYDYYFTAGKQFDLAAGTDAVLYGATLTNQHVYGTVVTRGTTEGGAPDYRNYTLSNTRLGDAVFNFDKTWVDGNNQLGNRPAALELTVSRGNATVATVRLDSTTVTDGNQNHWAGTTKGAVFLPKYDEQGALYTYTVTKKALDVENAEVDLAALEYSQVATENYTVGNAKNAHTSDVYDRHFVNTKSASKAPRFYKLWLDSKDDPMGLHRPDVFVTLYRSLFKNGAWETPTPVTSYINSDWTTRYSNYDWAVIYDAQPKYNAEGYEYAYYVKETMVQSNTDYIAHYYPGNVNEQWTTTGTPTLKDSLGAEISGNDTVNGQFEGLIPIDGTIVNRREATRTIEGRKVWSGLDVWTEIPLNQMMENCPEVDLTLYRHDPAHTNGVGDVAVTIGERLPDPVSTAGLFSRMGAFLTNLLTDPNSNDPVTATVSGVVTSYNMGTFPKYDDNGQLIEYYVLEDDYVKTAYSGAFTFDKSHVNAFAITNEYTGGQTLRLEVPKTFDGYQLREGGKTTADGEPLPDIEFLLDAYMPLKNSTDRLYLGRLSSNDDPDNWTKTQDGWEFDFVALKKYAPNLEVIQYTLKEACINGYAVEGLNVLMNDTGVVVTGETLQNALNIYTGGEKLTATVTKKWSGLSWSQDKLKPYMQPTTFTLQRHTQSDATLHDVGTAITLTGVTDNWTAEWTELETYAPSGEAYIYSVTESAPEGSLVDTLWTLSRDVTLSASAAEPTKLKGTATNTLKTITVTPKKVWALDGGPTTPAAADVQLLNKLDALPNTIAFTLYQNNAAYADAAAQTLTVKNGGSVQGTAVKVPMYLTDGTTAEYEWREADQAGTYQAMTAGTPDTISLQNGISVTTNTLPVKPLTITKTWSDAQNRDGLRPTSVSFDLSRDGCSPVTIQLTAAANATAADPDTWEKTVYVPVYTNANRALFSVYLISEITVTGYEIDDTAGSLSNSNENPALTYTLTNTHELNNSVEVQATKKWTDNTTQYQNLDNATIPQQTLTLTARAAGVPAAALSAYVETLADENFEWTQVGDYTDTPATWSGLPAFYQNNSAASAVAITYSADEADIPGWDSLSTDGTCTATTEKLEITVTNSRQSTQLTANKVWDDGLNKYATRPDSISFNVQYKTDAEGSEWTNLLTADGDVQTVSIDKDSTKETQTVTLSNLPKTSHDGTLNYSYRAVENETGLGAYTATQSADFATTTNTLSTVTLAVKKEMPRNSVFDQLLLDTLSSVTYQVQYSDNGGAAWSVLTDDGITVEKTATIAEDFGCEFTGLPGFAADGTPRQYRAVETSYTTTDNTTVLLTAAESLFDSDTATGTVSTGETASLVTNSLADTVAVEATKKWADDNNLPLQRPDSVSFSLFANGEKLQDDAFTTDVTGDATAAEWTVEWEDLPQYDALHNEIAYTVEENTEPTNYTRSYDDLDGLVVINTIKTGSAQVKKVDALTGEPMEGVTFTLTNKTAGSDQTALTDATGVAKFENLYYGDEYELTESATLDTYLLSDRSETFTLSDEEENFVVEGWANDPTHFTFKKVQTTGEPLEGAVFGLFDGETKLDECTSDADVLVSFRYFLKDKTYIIEELSAPEGFFVNATRFTLVVDADGNTTMRDGDDTVTQVVDEDMGSIALNKTDLVDGTPLAGATFTLTDEDGNTVDTQTTDDAGKLLFADLAMGKYTISETKAPSGYVLPTNVTSVTLKRGSSSQNITVSRTNHKAAFGFNKTLAYLESVYKSDTTPFAGARFTLYSSKDCTDAFATAESAANGRVEFENIPVGTHYLKETKLPNTVAPVMLDETVRTVVVNEDGTVTIDGVSSKETTVLNKQVTAEIVLKKVSESDHSLPLAGSTYGLYRVATDEDLAKRGVASNPLNKLLQGLFAGKEEILLATAVTDKDGLLRFPGVLIGVDYTLRELKSPAGYEVSKDPIQIRFKLDAETGKPVVDKFDNGNDTAEMDENGVITWHEPATKALFLKTDEAGNLLAGAKLRITNRDGSRVDGVEDWVSSDKEGHLIEGALTAGQTYLLQELEAPAGYRLADPLTFTLTDSPVASGADYVQRFTLVNELLPKSHHATPTPAPAPTTPPTGTGITGPATGDNSALPAMLYLFIGAALCLGVVIHLRKRK